MTSLQALLQHFFTDRLMTQLEASPNTVVGYRDTFRLLLRYAGTRLHRAPTALTMEDIDADLVGNFLSHVEKVRRNSTRSRNTRLAAIRSFFRYVAVNEPAYALHCQRILDMPNKRHVRRMVNFIDRSEMDALLASPDTSTWIGRRDAAILLLLLQTGLRVTENLAREDADELTYYEAFVSLALKGRTVGEIARTYGRTEREVQGYLALANLLSALRELYRSEHLDAGDLRLLTMATKTQQRDWLKLFKNDDAPCGSDLKGWLLCRTRHNSHYPECVIMPSTL